MSSPYAKDFNSCGLNSSNFHEIFSQQIDRFDVHSVDPRETQEEENLKYTVTVKEERLSNDFFEENEIEELADILSNLNESIQWNWNDFNSQCLREEREECKGEILSILLKKPISTKNTRATTMPVCFRGQQRKISLTGRVWVNSTENYSLPTQCSSANEADSLRLSMK